METRNGFKQGQIHKIESEFNTSDIGPKNAKVNLFERHAEEIDTGMPMLRERIYGQNGILE